MTLEQDITDAIKKSLPAHMSQAIQDILKEGDEAKVNLKKVIGRSESQRDEILSLSNRCTQQEAELKKHADLQVREDVVSLREHNADITELKTQLAAAKEIAEFAKQTTKDLVRNTEFRESVFRRNDTPVVIPTPGGAGYTTNHQTITQDNNTKSAA